ncbi:TetR/AcrR family transcriptional regulator [Paenibacillus oenotherae]|uniref:TetR/AcrR family transcriptional regulator n=1 Tax=Paenibacillus oenotherae TaxID=1435645 RepID=A0ABS7D6H8_9BACL|nr:TetR/AcrR family transcriptional regulator [Paenibacillus oenotherae]
MVRTKEFEPVDALEKAMKVFWKHGYEKTSVNDLLKEMGINRGSMYDTFGDKHSLFMACLSRYSEVYMSQVLWALSQNTPVYSTLMQLFHNVIDRLHEDQKSWGCLMVNTASELSLHDSLVAEVVTNNFLSLEQAFALFLEQGKIKNEVPPELDCRKTAQYLTSSFVGVATLAKTNLPPDFIRSAIQVALRIF